MTRDLAMYLFRLLLAIWCFGLIGTSGELLLLGHFDGVLQIIPLVLVAVALATSGWYVLRPGPRSLSAFRATLLVLTLSGILGLYLHYRGNVEFEKETDPALGGLQLFWNAITGATPALAPGTMVLLALIGYALTVSNPRHPFRTGDREPH